jgi:hypothetical protein
MGGLARDEPGKGTKKDDDAVPLVRAYEKCCGQRFKKIRGKVRKYFAECR